MPQSATQWGRTPSLPPTHYVDSRIYTDQTLFEEEREKIFEKVWSLVCHESEVPNAYDFRRCQHMSGKELLVIRGKDKKIRTFYNQCPHRGNVIAFEPSGNAKRLTCIFHLWSFDTKGNCVEITREKEGFQDRLSKKDVGLREVKTDLSAGGFVWVNIDDDCGPLEEFIDGSLDCFQHEFSTKPLEIISYHKAIVPSNYKLWHDTNRELYHEYLHRHNRMVAVMQPGYFDRLYHIFSNGHMSADPMDTRYDAYEGYGGEQRKLGWPGGGDTIHKFSDLFPVMTFNLRPPALRIDTMVPLGPDKTIIEYRGLGIKGDTPAERAERFCDHNAVWGPFGRNLSEDQIAVVGQMMAIKTGRDNSYILHGREENGAHDDICLRHYYSEWSKRMGRSAADPFNEQAAVAAE
ncbi:MAG: methanesulfonate monooxygenase [Thiotrichales bacterium]|nr:methanesulfonate monooxygenase [Thiotrichales bacterium]